MRKFLISFLIGIFIAVIIFLVLNVNVTTKVGVNYKVETVKIPLYLKILDFFDRHYNYIHLVNNIIRNAKDDEGRVLKIFDWTCDNIRKIPSGFPVMDDHTWNIIVRGYGASDQRADVFVTLCNYAGLEAFYCVVPNRNNTSKILLSFIKIKNKWSVFSPSEGVYFVNKDGKVAYIEEIKLGNWQVRRRTLIEKENFDFEEYIPNLTIPAYLGLHKANIQSPLRRFIYQVKKVISRNN